MFGFWSISTQKIAGAVAAAYKNIIMKLSGDGYNKEKNNVFVDESNNYFGPVTANGNSTQGSLSPFGNNCSWFFDGTGDYLSIDSSSAFTLGSTDNFTIECWVNSSVNVNGYSPIVTTFSDFNTSAGYVNRWFLGVSNNATVNKIRWYDSTGNGFIDSVSSISLNAWTHIAVVRNSGTITLYVNGVIQGTQTSNMAYTTQSGVSIGFVTGGGAFNGYISNLRVVKGTAVYTANFTPPTTALTAVANTSLLTCQNLYLYDNSVNNSTITINGDAQSRSFGPFDTTTDISVLPSRSWYFDGTGDSLSIPASTNLATLTGDFTYECWVYPTSASVTYRTIFGIDNYAGGQPFRLYQYGTNFQFWYTGEAGNFINSPTITINSWYHLAITRQSGVIKFFVNGIQAGNNLNSNANYPSSIFRIGIDPGGSLPFIGYISNVRVVKGTAVYTAAFTPSTSPLTAVANTALLTCQGNVAADSSTNNLTVTVNGDARVTANSPFSLTTVSSSTISTSNSFSAYFDGTGDSLSIPASTNLATLTGDFTYECWVYPTSASVTYRTIFGIDNYGIGQPFRLYQYGTNFQFWYTSEAGNFINSPTITINSWYHLAITRQSGVIKFFVNGIQAGNNLNSNANYPSSIFRIGIDPGESFPFIGYISNVRVVKGTAVYTAAFTPSTSPLTAVANTALLTCRSAPIADASTNNFTVTVNGDARVTANSPFNTVTNNSTPITTQSVTPVSHSVYFDGTGDYLTVPSSSNFGFDTGDFTVECWVYFRSTSNYQLLAMLGDGVDATPVQRLCAWSLYLGDGALNFNRYAPAFVGAAFTWAPVTNQWYHVTVTRSGSSLRAFVNGVQIGTTVSNSTNYSVVNATPLHVGRFIAGGGISYFLDGYISNLRVVKGTALYTAAFTPSTSPLTAVANTSLLTCQSANIVDNSTNAFSVTVNGDARPIINSPFTNSTSNTAVTPSWSGFFDGTGDWLTVPANTAFAFGTGDYTIEFWLYLVGTGDFTVFDNQGSGGLSQISRIGGVLYHASASSWSYTFTNNVWTHIAFSRQGTNLRLFANGILQQTQTNTGSIGGSAFATAIGVRNDGFYPLNGYISNLRVVKGTAVYTSAFTPPTTPLTAVANTSLLTCQGPRFIDNSTNNFAITVSGDAKTTMFGPFLDKGSMNFNGTSYLSIPANAAFTLGSGDYTVECWIRPAAITSTFGMVLVGTYAGLNPGDFGWGLYISSAGKLGFFSYGTTSATGISIIETGSRVIGMWQHVAVTRRGTTVNLYANGAVVATTTSSKNEDFSRSLKIGTQEALNLSPNLGNSTASYNGAMADVRVVKGTAVYSGPFIPPTAPLTAVANTSVLIPGIRNFTDTSSNAFAVTVSGATVNSNNTGQPLSPYDNYYSYFFNGSASLALASNAAFGLGTGAFTIECWVYPSANPANGPGSFLDLRSGQLAESTALRITNALNLGFYDGPANAERITTSYVFNLNEWHHLAITRLAGSTTANIWVNGAMVDRVTITANLGAAYPCLIGSSRTAGYGFNGYINNLRIVKDCLYTLQSPPTPYTNPVDNLAVVAGTSLLTCNDKSIVDVANNYAITNTSVTTTNQFVPFNRIYSTYFGGTSGHMTINHSNAINILSGDFTIEFWFNSEVVSGIRTLMAQWSQVNGNEGWLLRLLSNNTIDFWWGANSTSSALITSAAVNMGTWNHVAVTRLGSTFTMWLNGNSVGTGTTASTRSYLVLNTSIGNRYNASSVIGATGESYYKGYISNARITKSLAVYTSSFTPSFAPLTTSSNTGFLGCQCMNMLDNSGNNLYTFNSSDTRVEPIHPFSGTFTPTRSTTSGSLLGGSAYFDGTGDYLSIPANDAFIPQAGEDFTIEFWWRPTAIVTGTVLTSGYNGSTQVGPFLVYLDSANTRLVFYSSSDGTNWNISTNQIIVSNVKPNVWYHVAISRSTGNLRLFANGVLTTTIASSTAGMFRNTLYSVTVGSALSGANPTAGYISNLRILRGAGLYTNNFAPPPTPSQTLASSSLTLNFRNAGIYDAVGDFVFETVGDAQLSTVQKKNGATSMYFDGSGDYLTSANSDLAFGTGDFTVEFWMYSADVSGATQRGLFQTSTTTGGLSTGYTTGISIFQGANGVSALNGGCSAIILGNYIAGTSTSVLTTNVWHHIAITRSGGNCRLFVNGVQHGTTTAITGAINATNIAVGGAYSSAYLFSGYIDDFRISRSAQYTNNFTPT